MNNLSFGENDMAKVAAKKASGEKKDDKVEKAITTKEKSAAIEKIGKEQAKILKMVEELYAKYPTNELYSAMNSIEEVLRKFETLSDKIEQFG